LINLRIKKYNYFSIKEPFDAENIKRFFTFAAYLEI